MAVLVTGSEAKKLDKTPSFDECRALISEKCSLIQTVWMNSKSLMLVDEEGLMNELPINEIASEMTGITIVGNAVILTGVEINSVLNS